jgi:outer membrane usher protein
LSLQRRIVGTAALFLMAFAWMPFAAAQDTSKPKNTAAASADLPNINPTGRDVSLVVPLRENGPLGQVEILITAKGQLLILVQDLNNALARIVKPAELAKLKSLANDKGYISLEAAATEGFKITYDPNAIELAVQIPLAARLTSTISLGLDSEQYVLPDKSSPFAAYLNYRVGAVHEFDGAEEGKTDLQADLELSGRLFDNFAFENFATIDQESPNVFSRSASRAIYDIPGPALRITAGDLTTESTAFQSSPQIAGINISHLIDTFYPATAISGSSSRTLSLTRASDVQLLVNNQQVAELHLNPGTYDLRNLPIAQGANNVQAVVTDDTGQRVVQSFNFFSDVNLLTPGVDEYTASLGILSPFGVNGPEYHTSQPAFSGFYRLGLTEQITAGFDAQATRDDQLLGLDGVLGTKFGLFSVNLAANRLSTDQTGYAARLLYRYADETQNTIYSRTIDASLEFESRHFLPVDDNAGGPGGIATENNQAITMGASINQPIFRDLALEFTGDYEISRAAHANAADLSAFLNYQAPFDTSIGVGVTYQFQSAQNIAAASLLNGEVGRGFSFSVTLTHRFSDEDLVTASADRFQQRFDYSRSPINPIGDYFANADFNRVDSAISTTATGGYETNRGNIEATYSNNIDPNGTIASQQVGAFFDGSVALADGHVGLGQHVTDAFAVVSGDPTLDGHTVYVDSRFANQVVAETGPLGPAVVGLSSYNKQVIPYDVEDLPPGYNLGDGNFEIYPWFHSGFALKVGSPYNVTAIGTLLDRDGQPVVLRTGGAVSETDPKAPPVEVITNRTGRFAAAGLSPGRWRLTIPGDQPLVYHITITKAQGMLVRMGNVAPDGSQPGDKR